ncbi:MAG: PDZ domain-containing protein [Tepidisphaeraceae bacterium]
MRNTLIAGILTLACVPLAGAQTTRPALSQLDAEMRALYADVAAGTVRVRLPAPAVARLMGPEDHPLNKWREQLDARVLRKLEELPTSQPGDKRIYLGDPRGLIQGDGDFDLVTVVPDGPKSITYLDDIDGSRMVAVWPRELGRVDFVGIVLNDAGHVAIPAYVAPEELGDRPVRVTAGQEQLAATFVGSDRQTNVTVFKLAKPAGKPLPLAAGKPALGSLVLVLSPTRTGAKLALWTGGQDDNAIIINVADGTVAGFARPGQMLACKGIKPVTDQIIQHGKVKRAQLGVMIVQVQPNDPIRQEVALLGARPALRVGRIFPATAAESAGLKVDDLIMSLGDQPVDDLMSFAAAISSHNGPTELKIIRDGKETTVTVNLEPR